MIEIIKRLEELNLTPNQYFYLYSLYLEAPNKEFITSPEQLSLEIEGWIGYDDNVSGGEWILRNKGRNLFETKKDSLKQQWLEFKGLYPIKSGVRRLHDQVERCEVKYVSLIQKNPKLHKEIMLGLNNEMLARQEATKKRLFMSEWKLMSSWLNQSHWKTYLDYKEEQVVTNTGTTSGI